MAFNRAVIKVASSKEKGITVQLQRSDEDFFRDCFEIPNVHMSQKLYTVMASYSGSGKNNWHIIHSIIFNDLEDAIKSDAKHEKFANGGADILSIGNKDKSFSEKDSILAYNRQLLRYNNLYSNLYTKYEMNSNLINEIVSNFPEQSFMSDLSHAVYQF